MKIEIDVTGDNEATAYPWWVIVNPTHVVNDPPYDHDDDVDDSTYVSDTTIAFSITGPFFSRDEAESALRRRHYDYHPDAAIWCLSGHETQVYRNAIDAVGATDGEHVYR
jgi:hypothetical protein